MDERPTDVFDLHQYPIGIGDAAGGCGFAPMLIQIKSFDIRIDDVLAKQGSKTMSLESTIILSAIALAFAIFAAALAWGDVQTRNLGNK